MLALQFACDLRQSGVISTIEEMLLRRKYLATLQGKWHLQLLEHKPKESWMVICL